AGHIDLEIEPVSNFLEQVRAGNLKAYAIAGKTRLSAAPDIPTVDEAGLPGFHRSAWVGLWMPKGAPTDVVAKLSAAVQVVMADSNLLARIAAMGQESFPRDQQTPDGLQRSKRPRSSDGGRLSNQPPSEARDRPEIP